MKRWAASQRGSRWALGRIAPGGLARHDVGPARQPLPRTAPGAAPGRVLTVGAGLLAAGALLFTVRTFVLARDRQVTGRCTMALEQLGSGKLDVRIGAIYALERVARDSAADHPAVMQVLAAFIREHSREPWPQSGPAFQGRERPLRPDVHAAITVVGRRLTDRDIRPVDLACADLTGADLDGADLAEAVLAHAVLARADLPAAKLARADLTGADLGGARLTGADLTRADFTGADLSDADLTGADLTCAKLTRAELTGALWPLSGPVPEGWKRHAGSGQLTAADAGAETTMANQSHR